MSHTSASPRRRGSPLRSDRAPRALVLALLPALAFVTGCDRQDTQSISEVRIAERPRLALGATSAQRFGMGDAPAAAASPRFDWRTPEGWTEKPPSSMRLADFDVPGGVECYFTVLPGAAGGLAANVNRWRKQMGLEPTSESEIAALPTRTLLGSAASFVDLVGTYTGMGGPERAGWRMAGMVQALPRVTAFVKMVGPGQAVAAQLENLESLAASIAFGGAKPAATTSGGAAQGGGLSWTTPEGWIRGAEKQMRLATLIPEAHPEVECSVMILGGDGGGIGPNINRWRGQVGLPPLSDAEIAQLPRLDVAGQSAPMVEATGHYTGMGDVSEDGSTLLGVVCPLGGETLFVKMVGPQQLVLGEKDRFVAFCESMRR